MDENEIKVLLKKARTAISDEDYKIAIKHCKAVLKANKTNYNAWVLVATCFQRIEHLDQAAQAFQKATEIAPERSLAWQGLCDFYEKSAKEEYTTELITAYEKLFLLLAEEDKKLEVIEKVIELYKKMSEKEKLSKALKVKLDLLRTGQRDEFEAQKQIFSQLSGRSQWNQEEKTMLCEALQAVLSHESAVEDMCRRLFENCVLRLMEKGEKQFGLSLAILIHQRFPLNIPCLEFLAKETMQDYVENDSLMKDIDVQVISEHFKFCSPPSKISFLWEGFNIFINKKYEAAIESLKNDFSDLRFNYVWLAFYFLSKSYLSVYQYDYAEMNARKGVEIAEKGKADKIIHGKFYLIIAQASLGKECWDTAFKSLDKCFASIGKSKEFILTFCSARFQKGDRFEAEKMLNDLKELYPNEPDLLQLEGHILILKNAFEAAIQKLRESASIKDSAFTLYLIGLALWKSEQREKAFQVFCAAVQKDPFYARNFLFIGHYFLYERKDNNKACMMYRRAFDLQNNDSEIGKAFSNILHLLNEQDENMKILKIIVQSNTKKNHWAWVKLGVLQFKKNQILDSIFSFNKALSVDPQNSFLWWMLSETYFKRMMVGCALKTYEKVVELNPNSKYHLYRIAQLLKMKSLYTESDEKYRELLKRQPTFVPAILGLAENSILAAKNYLRHCTFGEVKASCQEVLHILSSVAQSGKSLVALWKLAGDACSIPYALDSVHFPIEVPAELSGTDAALCNKTQLLAQGSRFYERALLLNESIHSIWHDLGVNLHYCSLLSASEEASKLAKRAFTSLQKAISLCPNYQPHWTALGVIALGKVLKNYALGQHILIKSLTLYNMNHEPWSNLGSLYLQQGNVNLANLAFKRAQIHNLEYQQGWAGVAICAQKLQSPDYGLPLFRQACTLGPHKEALIGYSNAICQILLLKPDRESDFYKALFGVENVDRRALDCLLKINGNVSNCPEMYNSIGVFMERQRNIEGSLKAFERSLSLLENNDKESIEKVRANYARALSSSGNFTLAREQYMLLSKRVHAIDICTFALALSREGDDVSAFKLFKGAVEKAENVVEKEDIGLAAVLTLIKSAEMSAPNVKEYLTKCISTSLSTTGLLMICAEALQRNEKEVFANAKRELLTRMKEKSHISSMAFLFTTQTEINEGAEKAKSELSEFLKSHPEDVELHLEAADCLLRWDAKYAKDAALYAETALNLDGHNVRALQTLAVTKLSQGYTKQTLVAAQKAIIADPTNVSNLVILAAACRVTNVAQNSVGWIYSIIKKAGSKEVKADLMSWSLVSECIHLVIVGNLENAQSLVKQLLTVGTLDLKTKSCLEVMEAVINFLSGTDSNLSYILTTVKNTAKCFFGWQILSQLLVKMGDFGVSEKPLTQFVTIAEKLFPEWAIFSLLQVAFLSYKGMKKCEEGHYDKWLSLGNEVIAKASSESQSVHFMRGIFALESANHDLARRSLEKVLKECRLEPNKWIEKLAESILREFDLRIKK